MGTASRAIHLDSERVTARGPVPVGRSGARWARAAGAQSRRWLAVALLSAAPVLLVPVAAPTTALIRVVTGGLAGYRSAAPAPPPRLDLLAAVSDRRLVAVPTTVAWRKEWLTVRAGAVLHDRSLWRDMHIDDWDRVPRDIREPALRTMMRLYRPILGGPRVWTDMTLQDWDLVPQPVRAMAYLRMVWYWADHEQLGAAYGLRPRVAAQTVAAIVMAESWFEHRAINVNAKGNRDLGLAQCSDYCRDQIAAMALDGAIDFSPSEADYFDPFVGSRVATVWFARELDRADGDVARAIRAYHRGIEAADDERGYAYEARVEALRSRYVLQHQAPPSWRVIVAAASSNWSYAPHPERATLRQGREQTRP